MRGFNISSTLFLILIVFDLTVLIGFKIKKNIRKKPSSTGSVLAVFLMNALLIGALIIFSINICITRYTIQNERIPKAFDGYKIVQISDFHSASFKEGTSKVINIVQKEKPDIIVLTGDLIDDKVDLVPVNQLVSGLVKLAPVYSVSGNHDVWFNDFDGYQKLLASKGVILQDNKCTILQRGTESINLFGIGDPNIWNDIETNEYLSEKMAQLHQDSGYNILLFHRANMFDIIKGNGYQLVFSGHMHGGQIQLPFIGGLVSPHESERWFPKYTDGKFNEEGTTLIVNRGLGNSVGVPRVFNPPEIVVVTLKTVK